MQAIWTGGISFGLVYIPVKLYSAVSETATLDLHLLRKKDACRIKYVRVCESTGEEVAWKDIVKGYKYKKGDYIILLDEDFEKAYPKKSKALDIINFVDLAEVDPKFYEKPYFLEPEKEAAKTYILLREALKKSNKAGFAKFVMHNKEHIGLLVAEGEVIYLYQMHFAEEMRKPTEVKVPSANVSKKELDMALHLIGQMTEPFKPEKYKDNTKHELLKIIEAKAKRGKTQKPLERATKKKPIKVDESSDLMKMLKASLVHSKN